MSNFLNISEISFSHSHLRKKIKKWVKKGWAKEVNRYRDDECRLYQMHMPYYITEDNKLKADYNKLARIKVLHGGREGNETHSTARQLAYHLPGRER